MDLRRGGKTAAAAPRARLGRLARRFFLANYALSSAIEKRLPERFTNEAHEAFDNDLLPEFLKPHQTVYALGGGENPGIDAATKARLDLRIVGVDISAEQMGKAPAGLYDKEIQADVRSYIGQGDADVVIFRTVLEHIDDVDGAARAIESTLAPGGHALLLVPCRNALFARLNLLMPESLKRRLLAATKAGKDEGYQAYYEACTPKGVQRLAARHGLVTTRTTPYYYSDYFYFLFPAYLAWRAWSLMTAAVVGGEACEIFTAVLERPDRKITGQRVTEAAAAH